MSKVKSKKTYWWLNKYSVDDHEYKKEKSSAWWGSSYKNPTKGWMDKLGGYDLGYSWTDKKKNRKDLAYKKLLDQLQTSINVIDCDKNLKVRWSSGEDINSPENDIIFLSPNDLIEGTGVTPVVQENILDVLTGKVYLSKVLHGQISKKDYNLSCDFKRMGSKKLSVCVSKLWESLEAHIAKKFMEDNWQGFMPHVIKELDYSSSNKEAVQKFINDSVDQPSIYSVTLGISWNLVHEHNPIEIPSVYDECLDSAADMLEKSETEDNRFKACSEIINQINIILKEKEESRPSLKNSSGSLSIRDFQICDGQLFGEPVKNNVDQNLSNIKTSSEAKGSSSLTNCNGFDISSLNNKFDIPRPNLEDKEYYVEKVKNLKNVIQGIKNNFYFINNKMTVDSYGHLSGDIDENNLYKLRLNDDRVMCKTDIVSQKQISVCLLVDESGSMEDLYTEAVNVAVALSEGLKDYFGVHVYGHTAETSSVNGCHITEYYTPRNKRIESCINIHAKNENIDGVAIELVAKKFYQDCPDKRRIIFHISDGEPASSYYSGVDAIQHVDSVCQMVRSKLDTEVYGIGICNAFGDSTGRSLYGKNNYVVLDDVQSSIGIITRFLKQICNKNAKVYS
jgi:hypothetical protein